MKICYRQMLKEKFEARVKRNPSFSLRAYARFLGMPAPQLSDILRGRYGISTKTADEIADRLQLDAEEREWFRTSVESRHSRSRSQKEKAMERLRVLEDTHGGQILESDVFHTTSDWHHLAILKLTELSEFQADPTWISHRLGLPKPMVESALDRMFRLGVLEKTGGTFQVSATCTLNPPEEASIAQKKLHQQMAQKAMDGLAVHSAREQHVGTATFSFDSSQMDEAKRAIQRFQAEFQERFGKSSVRKDRLYAFHVQLFPLDLVDQVPRENSLEIH